MTIIGNIPMNNRLSKLDPSSQDAENYWELYGHRWTRLNHYRSLASLLTAGLYTISAVTLIHTGQV